MKEAWSYCDYFHRLLNADDSIFLGGHLFLGGSPARWLWRGDILCSVHWFEFSKDFLIYQDFNFKLNKRRIPSWFMHLLSVHNNLVPFHLWWYVVLKLPIWPATFWTDFCFLLPIFCQVTNYFYCLWSIYKLVSLVDIIPHGLFLVIDG